MEPFWLSVDWARDTIEMMKGEQMDTIVAVEEFNAETENIANQMLREGVEVGHDGEPEYSPAFEYPIVEDISADLPRGRGGVNLQLQVRGDVEVVAWIVKALSIPSIRSKVEISIARVLADSISIKTGEVFTYIEVEGEPC